MSNEGKLTYDFFYIDQELPKYTHTVTEEEIDNFCKSFKEKNPVYLYNEAAKKAGFEGRIAPSMMVRYYAHIQNILKGFHETVPGHSIHVSGEYCFLHPVKAGDTITTRGKVLNKYIKKGRKFFTFELISENQDGETVVINVHTSIWPK
jgi:acyl dehydratase